MAICKPLLENTQMSNSKVFTTAQECAAEVTRLRGQRIACRLQKLEGGGFTVVLMNGKAQPQSQPKAKPGELPTIVQLRITADGGVWSNKGEGFKPVTNGMSFEDCRDALIERGYQKLDKNLDRHMNQTWMFKLAAAEHCHDLDISAYIKGLEDGPASFGHGDVPLEDFGMYCIQMGSYLEVSVPFNKGAAAIKWLAQYAKIHNCEVTPFECEGDEPEDYIYALSVCIYLHASSVSKELSFELRHRSI
jgi:hypothetical protein